MDVICIDGKFSSEQLEFYSRHGVVFPEQESFYTIRDVIINSNGKTGILLEEIVNPKVPIEHPLLGQVVMMEINWDVKRFRNLDQSELNISEIKKQLADFVKL